MSDFGSLLATSSVAATAAKTVPASVPDSQSLTVNATSMQDAASAAAAAAAATAAAAASVTASSPAGGGSSHFSTPSAFSIASQYQHAAAAAAFSSFATDGSVSGTSADLGLGSGGLYSAGSADSSGPGGVGVGIASFGFTQEQVACVCEVLEQSGNIDRLARSVKLLRYWKLQSAF